MPCDMSERENALSIFNQFVFADSIERDEKLFMAEEALRIGRERGREIRREFPDISVQEILRCQGVSIHEEGQDRGWGQDYVKFAEFHVKQNRILLNREALHRIGRHMDINTAREIILGHELYHLFECRRWGDTSAGFVRTVKLFGVIPVKHRMLPVSEIAAGSFTKELLGLSFEPRQIEDLYFA